MKKILIILAMLSKTTFAEVFDVDNKKLKMLLDQNIKLVDIRTVSEWKKTGVISKSHLLSLVDEKGNYSLQSWYQNFSKIKLRNNSVILICAVGGRSKYIAKILNRIDKNLTIFNVKKGILNWIKNKNPVVKHLKN